MNRRLLQFALCLLLLASCAFRFASAGLQDVGASTDHQETTQLRQQIAEVEKSLPQLPDRGAALYFLAASRQRLGETAEALKLLRQCLALHEGFDPAGSPSLKALQGSKEFDRLVEEVHRDFPSVQQARPAFVTREKDLVPEGMAYDGRQNLFYLSSLIHRKIAAIRLDGSEFDFVPAGRDHLLPILGIRVAPTDGTVWAASWDESSDKSELLHFNTEGGLMGRYAPKDAAPHGFNDLVVQKDGSVILTDSVSNQIFRSAAGTFASIPIYRSLFEPNGICITDDERWLFVADDFGIVRVDLRRGTSTDVQRGRRSTLAGADGLYWHNGWLIAVQNAIGSPRLVAFKLSREAGRVTQTTVLENRTDFTMSPTTGAIRGNDFYFMANTQGDNLDGDRVVDATKLEPVRIGVVPLP